jgi:hypothetical protein
LFFKENQGERKTRFREGKINEAIKEGKEYLRGYLQRNSSGDKEPGLSSTAKGEPRLARLAVQKHWRSFFERTAGKSFREGAVGSGGAEGEAIKKESVCFSGNAEKLYVGSSG